MAELPDLTDQDQIVDTLRRLIKIASDKGDVQGTMDGDKVTVSLTFATNRAGGDTDLARKIAAAVADARV